MKSLITMVIATIIGLVIVPVLTVVGVLVVGPIASFFLPEPSNTGMGFAYLGIAVIFYFIMYLFSVTLAGFIAGSFISRWGVKSDSRAYQGFISGLLIALIPPFLLSLVKFSGSRADSIAIAVISLFGGMAGLAGYYVAGRKFEKQRDTDI